MVSLRGSWRVLVRSTGVWLALSLAAGAANAAMPVCNGGNTLSPVRPLGLSNAQVLRWKLTTPNQFLARALVEGRIVKIYPDATGHNHFAIQLDANPQDILEVIYSQDFGALPPLRVGSVVVACGDYITSTARVGSLPPSPAGAIIHWVHMSDSQGHANGFLMIDNVVYGNHPGPGGRHPLE